MIFFDVALQNSVKYIIINASLILSIHLLMKKTVLIIDDFENTLFVTGFTIKNARYNVLEAKSGKEALKILRNSGSSIDLIVSDFNMPEMNGLELVIEIKKMPDFQSTPIFILSSEKNEQTKHKTIDAGATLWIKKPFHPAKLVEYIKRTID